MNFQQPAQSIQVPAVISNVGNSVSNALDQAKTGFNSTVSGFSAQTPGSSASQGFLQSNTIIAKFAFLILIIIGFLILLTLGVKLLSYFLSPPKNPYVIKGMVDGNINKIVPSDPKQSTSVMINRSNNESKGMEFTWSFWIRIDDLGNNTIAQHIFNKGDSTYGSDGISSVNNGPGVYLLSNRSSPATSAAAASASLLVIMNTSDATDTNNKITIDNIPLRKWVNVAMRMQNTIFDIYINGIVANRLVMQHVPKQNFNDINIGQNGGFAGKLSNLRYYDHALNAFDINGILYAGPDMKPSILDTSTDSKDYTYLSNIWYSSKM